ncbi:hypothetical protein HDU83_008549, partial [Entophlyctis luteolus]
MDNQQKTTELCESAIDWALMNGLIMSSATGVGTFRSVNHAPFALFPTPIPRHCFSKAVDLQPLFNTVVHNISLDRTFLKEVMDKLSRVDDFVAKCYDIYNHVLEEGSTQPVTLGIHRSDYLLHQSGDADGNLEIQQVELNTISASFASLSSKTTELHKFLYNRANSSFKCHIPQNDSLIALTKGLARAWQLYGNKQAVVAVIVQPGEKNSFDQKWLEHVLLREYVLNVYIPSIDVYSRYGVASIRRTMAEIFEHGKLVGAERKLFLNEEFEVAVAYYRSGYAPNDYPTEN